MPRERLIAHGPTVLTDAELLAVILGTGTRGVSATEFGEDLLERFGGMRKLLAASIKELKEVKGLGNAKICQITCIRELATRALNEELTYGPSLDFSMTVKKFCAQRLGHLNVEHCIALFLDTRFRLICTENISQGTLTETSVYPRELVKSALAHHAAAVIVAHNHPSGNLQASQADIKLTRQIKQALNLMDIQLLDHIIVGAGKGASMAEEGHV